jgi:hypothetical protein
MQQERTYLGREIAKIEKALGQWLSEQERKLLEKVLGSLKEQYDKYDKAIKIGEAAEEKLKGKPDPGDPEGSYP